jgi:hypothetical protein
MAGYQAQSGGDIGNLLRLIQEEKAGGVLNQPPAADPSAPVRGVVQQPIQSPNDPGSARTVSTPPDAGQAPVESIIPVAPGAAPITPINSGAVSRPNGQSGFTPVATPSPIAAPINLGTSIKAGPVKAPSATIAKAAAPGLNINKDTSGLSFGSAKTPQSSRIGTIGIGGTIAKVAPKIASEILPTVAKGLVKGTGGGLLDINGYLKALSNIFSGKKQSKSVSA